MSELTPSRLTRSTLLMWAAGICAVMAMALALTTHRGSSAPRPGARHDQVVRHRWVRGLFANNDTHAGIH